MSAANMDIPQDISAVQTQEEVVAPVQAPAGTSEASAAPSTSTAAPSSSSSSSSDDVIDIDTATAKHVPHPTSRNSHEFGEDDEEDEDDTDEERARFLDEVMAAQQSAFSSSEDLASEGDHLNDPASLAAAIAAATGRTNAQDNPESFKALQEIQDFLNRQQAAGQAHREQGGAAAAGGAQSAAQKKAEFQAKVAQAKARNQAMKRAAGLVLDEEDEEEDDTYAADEAEEDDEDEEDAASAPQSFLPWLKSRVRATLASPKIASARAGLSWAASNGASLGGKLASYAVTFTLVAIIPAVLMEVSSSDHLRQQKRIQYALETDHAKAAYVIQGIVPSENPEALMTNADAGLGGLQL